MNETLLRVSFFIGALIIFSLWEIFNPRVVSKLSKRIRWCTNLGLVFFNHLIIRIFIPISSMAVCLYAQNNQIGLFNNFMNHSILVIVLSILFLDLIIYFQHLIFHHIPIFWRLHKIHHTDQEIDVTTALRFHPLEIIFSLAIKFSAILIFGIPVIAMLIFEILLNFSSMFNHSNIKISQKIDSLLKWLIVTPDMHRVHHSVIVKETNSNFGFNLSLWDRLFKTYKEKPFNEITSIKIGLKQYPKLKQTQFIDLIKIPFLSSQK